MSKRYSNSPVNCPRRRRDPALKTLAVVGAAVALTFGIKLIYDPPGDLADVAAMAGVFDPDPAPDTAAGPVIEEAPRD